MGSEQENRTVILLRDEHGALVAYVIDEVLEIAGSDYTVLLRLDGVDEEPVIVRALDADIPSYVGVEDEGELALAMSEYRAAVARRSFRLVV